MSGRHHLRRTGSPSYFFLDAAIGRGEQAAVRHRPAKPGELNEDTLWLGFERIGSELVACCAVRELA